MRIRIVLGVLCTALWLGISPNVANAKEPASEGDAVEATTVSREKPEFKLMVIEENIINYTNAQRQRYGLPPLAMDENLVKSAREHAIWMARCQTLQHTRKMVAENIAMGYPSSQSTVQGWMNSSGHRANILNSSYRRIGVAAYQAHNGTIYWCQQFMR